MIYMYHEVIRTSLLVQSSRGFRCTPRSFPPGRGRPGSRRHRPPSYSAHTLLQHSAPRSAPGTQSQRSSGSSTEYQHSPEQTNKYHATMNIVSFQLCFQHYTFYIEIIAIINIVSIKAFFIFVLIWTLHDGNQF